MKKQNLVLTAFLSLSLSMPLFAQEANNNIPNDSTSVNNSTNTTTTTITSATLNPTTNDSESKPTNEVINNITFLKDDASLKQYLATNTEKPTLIFVYASWCGWCKKERPVLEQLAPKRTDVNVVAINYETAPEMVKKYDVKGYPTFVTTKDDKFTRDAGFMRKTDLNEYISENIRKVNKKAKMSY
jgi:thioredoxin 1